VASKISHYILAYLLWLVSCGLAVLVATAIRSTYHILLAFDFSQRYTARAVDNFSVLLLGIGILLVIVLVEHFYRTSVPTGQLFARFCLFTLCELGLLALLHITQFWVALSYQQFDTTILWIGGGELCAALVFGWLYRRARRGPRSLI